MAKGILAMIQFLLMNLNNKSVLNLLYFLIIFLFLFYFLFYIYNHVTHPNHQSVLFDYYTDSYGVIAGVAGVLGLVVGHFWGGIKSVVGRAVTMFGLGILFQFLGQLSYAWYRFSTGEEAPYPSLAEIFYVLSIPLYVYGIWQIAVASGVKSKLKNPFYLLVSALSLFLMMGLSYWFFLSNYDFSEMDPIVMILEIWYPLGQATYVTLAVLAMVLSKGILGGVMKSRVMLILGAFVLQFITDTYFSYDINRETFYPGNFTDLLYVISYFVMGMAIYSFGNAFHKINKLNK